MAGKSEVGHREGAKEGPRAIWNPNNPVGTSCNTDTEEYVRIIWVSGHVLVR